MKLLKGKEGEDKALKYLISNGYKLIERNFRSHFGEIDLIVEKDGVVVFVEVKYRHSNSFGSPIEAITEDKIKKIIKTAQYFIVKNNLNALHRFDIVAVTDEKIEHIKNAFTL